MSPDIPRNVCDQADWSYRCPCGLTHRVTTKKVLIGDDAMGGLPDAMRERSLPKRAWMLADENTFAAAGEQVVSVLRQDGVDVDVGILTSRDLGHIVADEANLTRALDEATDAEVYIGVGAGVINDLTRLAALERGKKYIAVATAASMNGYGSPISALLEKGVKVTKPTCQTELIVADLNVLCEAPVRLARAGFGDLLAKNSSNADWFLAHHIVDAYYCPVPVDMLRQAGNRILKAAGGIGTQSPDAIRVLIEGLIGGAFGMEAAGVSAPASGGEHLISHYIDMDAHLKNYEPAMHGEQVALGTVVAAAVYEELLALDVSAIDAEALVKAYPAWDDREKQLRADHGPLYDIVHDEAKTQHLTRDAYRQRLERIKAIWPTVSEKLRAEVLTCRQVRDAYESAGTPYTAKALEIDPALVRKAFLVGRDIRDRYTILHLAGDLGLLERMVDPVLQRSGVLD